MSWTKEDQATYLVSLPWTVELVVESPTEYVATIAELPFLVATGDSVKAASKDLFDALSTAIEGMLEHGDEIPVPKGIVLPWERGIEPPKKPDQQYCDIILGGEAWSPTASTISQSLTLESSAAA